MHLRPSILACLFLISHAYASDVLELRFSKDILAALSTANDAIILPLTERPPLTKYDKKTGEITAPVIHWLDARIKNGTPLPQADFEDLKALVLNPENHYTGLYAVGEPSDTAIRFTSEDQTGYIILHQSLVSIYWKEKCNGALLNDEGTKALELWKKQKDSLVVSPES